MMRQAAAEDFPAAAVAEDKKGLGLQKEHGYKHGYNNNNRGSIDSDVIDEEEEEDEEDERLNQSVELHSTLVGLSTLYFLYQCNPYLAPLMLTIGGIPVRRGRGIAHSAHGGNIVECCCINTYTTLSNQAFRSMNTLYVQVIQENAELLTEEGRLLQQVGRLFIHQCW